MNLNTNETQTITYMKPGIYKHYKGNLYLVIGVGKDSESLQEFVIYKSLQDNEYWVRPLVIFKQTMFHQGKITPRFSFVGEASE